VRVTYNGKRYKFLFNNWIKKETWYDIKDKNECLGSHSCEQRCVNTIGSYKCTCKKGFTKQGFNKCINVDECAGKPCKENTDCNDNIGSYQCTCKDGFKRRDFFSCEDINECLHSNQCDFKVASCVNHVGGYSCKCRAGFKRSTTYGCTDVDECRDGSHKCVTGTSTCWNLIGDYQCKCKVGYHQGQDPKICTKDKCGPLATPYQSVVSPSRCTQTDANYLGDVCTVACKSGYRLEVPKENSMKCGEQGRWKGIIPRCKPVQCPALSPLANGKLLPSTCTSVGNTYTGQCIYLCNNGFIRSGSPLRECQADRTWTGSKPTCIKVVPKPIVQCPTDIVMDLALDQKTADVSAKWKDPTYTGAVLQVDPSYASAKYQYPAGHTKVTWTTRNSAGSDSCSILIIVHDKQPPKTVSCPNSPVAVLTTLSNGARVTWTEPTFTDNVGVNKVTSTHKSGDFFDIATRNVYYTASDAAGNRATCTFEVVVKRKGCPALPGPHNGSKTCSSFGATQYCNVKCPAGRQLYNNPAKYNFWTCVSASWSPTSKIPDCVAATLNAGGSACTGNQVKMTVKTAVETKRYCADCPTGTYSTNGGCMECIAGQYQDQQGKSACKQCPSGTSSLPPDVFDVKHCRVVCRPGHYSNDGMDPGCQLCPRDTYQDQAQATGCKACPNGTMTLSPGTTKLSYCGVKPIISALKPLKLITIDERQSASMSCYASGVPAPDLKLKFRKVIHPDFLGKEMREYIKDSNGKTIGIKLTITGATFENSGNYECTAENSFGKAMALVARLTVNKVFGSGGGVSMDEEGQLNYFLCFPSKGNYKNILHVAVDSQVTIYQRFFSFQCHSRERRYHPRLEKGYQSLYLIVPAPHH
ncbi:hypothetical protein QZH41_016595, partial [Actinostola sp. cb2023]